MNSLHLKKYQTMVEELSSIRKSQGITQEALAKCLKKHQSYISKYENAERRLDLIEIMDICECMNYDLFDFIKKIKLEINT